MVFKSSLIYCFNDDLWGNYRNIGFQKLTFCKHVALHCATRKGDETSSSATTPIHDIKTGNREKLNINILAHIFFGIPLLVKSLVKAPRLS